jgi:Helix-turn-helix domain
VGPFPVSPPAKEYERMSTIKRAYVYRFYPTDEQKHILARTFGCVRYTYNWALRLSIDTYQATGKGLSYKGRSAQLTVLKQQEDTAFLNQISCVPVEPRLRHLKRAYVNFLPGARQVPDLQETQSCAVGGIHQERLYVGRRNPLACQDGRAPCDCLVASSARWRAAFHRHGQS